MFKGGKQDAEPLSLKLKVSLLSLNIRVLRISSLVIKLKLQLKGSALSSLRVLRY